ncbi:MAG: hypothetical protein QM765_49950 [Myxococcales bacterium]
METLPPRRPLDADEEDDRLRQYERLADLFDESDEDEDEELEEAGDEFEDELDEEASAEDEEE